MFMRHSSSQAHVSIVTWLCNKIKKGDQQGGLKSTLGAGKDLCRVEPPVPGSETGAARWAAGTGGSFSLKGSRFHGPMLKVKVDQGNPLLYGVIFHHYLEAEICTSCSLSTCPMQEISVL